jgi:predicted nucleic acid-binding protein
MRIVLDTSVLISAFKASHSETASRQVLRRVLLGQDKAVVGAALWSEWRDVANRAALFKESDTSEAERNQLLDALASVSDWTPIYFRWRPNLKDEADNHLIELALAGQVEAIVTFNLRDVRSGELRWPHLRMLTPKDYLEIADVPSRY